MQRILDWRNSAVIQKRRTGCIPTGYEFLLRMANISGINYNSFQDEFDLNMKNMNGNFNSVATAIKNVYPSINIKINTYNKGAGQEKLNKILEIFNLNQPVLASVNQHELTGGDDCHIMPVIGIWNDSLLLLESYSPNSMAILFDFPFTKFIEIHQRYPGGDDIAYLQI